MLKSIFSIAILGLCAGTVKAQDMLQALGHSPDLYINHTVKKGENFYSLGRTYGVTPKQIASANNTTLEKGLQLGNELHIPLTSANFSQKAGASGTPVYHKVAEKETLYRVSVSFNKVPLDNIRQWNNFSGDGLKKDSYLIVGYLTSGGGGAVAAATPAPKKPAPAPAAEEPAAEPVAEQPALPAPTKEGAKKAEPRPVQEQPEQIAEAPITTAPATTRPAPVATGDNFEEVYNQQTSNGKKAANEKGPGTWFKSNAVGKYYALHNTAPRGTIIKVTNPLNGKAIYAKVLDVIPQMKANAGLIVKLSDGAQQALGSEETKFYCELSYEK
ncbi:LysM peptidoglycan-binding domain-containing protein [Chitinophaga sp. sic0106]|uniref:LysM peptidoglycan-binding domain-containing protein n=1 Tax=Chitinophaga sp. sic0106 TaxID=2854785 RepID=UPI001C4896D3|nr:LysM peptidoglycan-binding domain-containing protein [Chitinophaga sp. sic0106]MBV7532760.1 LysM peptidoglycan-binding domain-containing protein [Chitinophaga sp. sic0106]